MRRILLLLTTLFLIACSDSSTSEQPSVQGSPSEASDNPDQAMLEMVGYMTVFRSGLKELGFGPEDAEAIATGLKKGLTDLVPDPEYQSQMEAFQEFIQVRLDKAEAAQEGSAGAAAEANIAEGKVFIESLASDSAVASTSSGLHYKIIQPGEATKPTMSDTVRVHYKGTRIDGTQFDSSYDRGAPADFPMNGVVSGFSEGLTQIGVGGEVILYIPSDLAYGNNPRSGVIQPGDTLIFECELIAINP